MGNIQVSLCGIDTSHTADHYYSRSKNDPRFLLMFFKTTFIYESGGEMRVGKKHSYLICPPYSHADHGSYREGFVNDWAFLTGEDVGGMIAQLALPVGEPFYVDEQSIIAPYIKKILEENRLKPLCYEDKVSAIAADMLIELGRRYQGAEQKHNSAFTAIERARKYMLCHIEEKISIDTLCKIAGYSESRFCILYRRFYGTSLIEELLTARLERAVALLSYGNSSVTQTARECGFSSVHYFSRKFKERIGVSPSEYLQKK